jgi:hypothetical protein
VGPTSQAAEKVCFRTSFVTGHDLSRADKPIIFLPEPALQFAEKLFFRSFRTKKPSQVIESSSVEMTEITKLVPFSANCLAGGAMHEPH